MAYIGKQPVVGNFQVCDAISVVNGQAAYTMQVASANVEPENANHMLVSLNGVLQKPGSSFTISGATITFASNLVTNDVIDFIILLGDTLNVGTPSDDSVGAAQIKADLISGTTALTSEPADTDEFLVSDAGTLKRIDYSLIKGGGKIGQVLTTLSQTASETNSGNSWGDLMSLAITPSASTSKILVLFNVNISTNLNNHVGIKAIRGSTDINSGNSGSGTRDCFTAIRHMSDDQYHVSNFAGQVLDSPSTTSETTYKIQGNSNEYYYFNRSYTNTGATTIQRPRTSSSLTLLEVLA